VWPGSIVFPFSPPCTDPSWFPSELWPSCTSIRIGPGARALSAALVQGTIRGQALPDHSAAELARLGLLRDVGEASAILLTEQTQCRFLTIDARRGRQIARARGIPVVGLAGVLLAAKRSGMLPSVASALTDLSREGYRLSDALVSEVLRLAGEAESAG
jgi:predicted nucleic acid-binding protein